ncbi:MAG: sensor domain-containing diguanylate cyclase [Pseudomonadota bacterium]
MKNVQSYDFPIDIDSFPQNIAIYRYENEEFIFVGFNRVAEKTEGMARFDLLGKKLIDVFPGVKEFGLYDLLLNVQKSHKNNRLDVDFYTDKRVSGWRKNELVYLPNGDVMVIYQDIPYAVYTQEAKVDRLLNLMDKSQTVVFYIKNQSNWPVEFVSSNIKQWGYNKEDFESQKLSFIDLVDDKDRTQLEADVVRQLEQGLSQFTQIYRIRTADGQTRWVEDSTVVDKDDRGGITQYLCTMIDITERKQIELELVESEQQFKLIAETMQAGIFIYTDYFEYANPAFLEISGYALVSLQKIRPWELLQQEMHETIKSAVKKRLQGETFSELYHDLEMVTQSGEKRTVRIKTQTISYKGGYAGIGSVVDITDIKSSQEQLKLLSQVVEQTEDLIRITDKEGIITYANPAFYKFTGFAVDEVVGKSSSILKTNHFDLAFYKRMWATIKSGESFKATFVNQKKNKEIFYEQQTITPILNADQEVQYFVGTGKDITARVLAEQENELLARTDKLTGAANRHKGDEFLEESILQAQRYHQPLSVILFDIDFFKAVNDQHGHQIGDDVLISLSELVKQEVRQTDLLVRWGGEEFLLIASQTNLVDAQTLAEKICRSIQKAIFGKVTQLTVSCGVTDIKGQETTQELLVRVDEALYKAKKTGRNKVVIR